ALPVTLQYAPTFVIDTLGYVCTGEYTFPSTLWAYSPLTNSWSTKAPFPGGSRFGATGFSLNGNGFIGLGCDYGYNDFKDFYKYNPETNSWDTLADFPGSRRHYVPGFSIGNKGYCGTGTNGTNLNDFWEFYYYIPQTDTTLISEGIQEWKENNTITVYPNPVSTSATIETTVTPVDFNLFDLSGKKVFEKNNMDCSFQFERNNLMSGIYFYTVTVHGNKIQTGKIILL
ncbi:MAG: T9SS type A sorting domain-containing protein, partial [Bacteroidota bacterium]